MSIDQKPAARTCGTCCSYEDGQCWNIGLRVRPGDRCAQHETEAEFTADVEALKRFRVAIGLPAQRGDQ